MAEVCGTCGVSFGSSTDLVLHVRKKHRWSDPDESLALNPEAKVPGLLCALCGVRLRDKEALARHNAGPHYRAFRSPTRNVPPPYPIY